MRNRVVRCMCIGSRVHLSSRGEVEKRGQRSPREWNVEQNH